MVRLCCRVCVMCIFLIRFQQRFVNKQKMNARVSVLYEKYSKNKAIVRSDAFKYMCGVAAALNETMMKIKKGHPIPKDTSTIPLPPIYDISPKGFEHYVLSGETLYKECLKMHSNSGAKRPLERECANKELLTNLFIDIATLIDNILAKL